MLYDLEIILHYNVDIIIIISLILSECVSFVPTSLETPSLSSYCDIAFICHLQLSVNDDKEYNTDNENIIHTSNVNYE